MALDSYIGLKAEIADYLDRDDLTNQIDGFIDLAEARHKREIRIREMLTRQTAELVDRYEALPLRFVQMRRLRLMTTPVRTLEQVTPDQMTPLIREQAGRPCYYAVHEELEFDRTPDQTYTMEMLFWQELTPLSDGNASNALLARAPDAYLYGALAASAPFLTNDERVATWEAGYVQARDNLNKMDAKIGGKLVARVHGPTP